VTELPAEVRDALAGRPTIGEWDAIFTLVTVESSGLPHVCLLSRSELEPDPGGVRAVVHGTGTIAALRDSGKATLVVIGADTAYYCRLQLASASADRDGLLAARLTMTEVKRDSAGVALRPPRFLPTAELRSLEHWERTARLLSEL
jgi:hypothetical protein